MKDNQKTLVLSALADADHLAACAENLLSILNRMASVAEHQKNEEIDSTNEESHEHLSELASESWNAIRFAAFEYRKRAERARDAMKEIENNQRELDRPNALRLSKSGYTLRVGYGDAMRMVAAPVKPLHELPSEQQQQWLFDAERLCDGWNNIDGAPFLQKRIHLWMKKCFGEHAPFDKSLMNYRFLEESLELVQSCGFDRKEAHRIVDYVFDRPVGNPFQEVGGSVITLSALCSANGLDMQSAVEVELSRVNQPDVIKKIQSRQSTKPCQTSD